MMLHTHYQATMKDFLYSTGRIWLDNVRCIGNAAILDDCRFSPWGQHDCDHDDDVGVMCVPSKLILCRRELSSVIIVANNT